MAGLPGRRYRGTSPRRLVLPTTSRRPVAVRTSYRLATGTARRSRSWRSAGPPAAVLGRRRRPLDRRLATDHPLRGGRPARRRRDRLHAGWSRDRRVRPRPGDTALVGGAPPASPAGRPPAAGRELLRGRGPGRRPGAAAGDPGRRRASRHRRRRPSPDRADRRRPGSDHPRRRPSAATADPPIDAAIGRPLGGHPGRRRIVRPSGPTTRPTSPPGSIRRACARRSSGSCRTGSCPTARPCSTTRSSRPSPTSASGPPPTAASRRPVRRRDDRRLERLDQLAHDDRHQRRPPQPHAGRPDRPELRLVDRRRQQAAGPARQRDRAADPGQDTSRRPSGTVAPTASTSTSSRSRRATTTSSPPSSGPSAPSSTRSRRATS